jgi:hypothetical protein
MIAIGRKHQYNDIELNLNFKGSGTIAIAVHDQRDWLVTKHKYTNFAGVTRSGVGIPYDIATLSGLPFADDIANNISDAFKNNGFQTTTIKATHTETPETVLENLKRVAASKLLLVSLNQWYCDVYNKTWMYYNVTAHLMNSNGEIIGNYTIENKEAIGESFWNPVRYARKAVPIFFKKKMEELLNAKEIIFLT